MNYWLTLVMIVCSWEFCLGMGQGSPNEPKQIAEIRSYSFQLGGRLSRSWDRVGDTSANEDNYSLDLSALRLGRHIHYGPLVSYNRFLIRYSDPSLRGAARTSLGFGVQVKLTLNDIQAARESIYVRTALARIESLDDDEVQKSEFDSLTVGFGYEFFLNSYVSLQPELVLSRSWYLVTLDDASFASESSRRTDDMNLQLNIGIYL
ncbi:hypothetical protein [Pseudobacteriovorax antillogorgiicola]|uniref:Outer membrane protein beta-barrel domain-containing protein n=1 Tax=Pseudobacteriovorax antillogorgiicola TaxID=1513793 RepID=A0A1Y6BV39_9BACT|nr:hypothetical protein [Pseudobacteriovorax antillogorgiicola]TCS53740.1 hypothetical protein EDD56_10749 [Pseudobacteriovorax antillogorgiicola]SMF22669.1 hypothetical protein SAMN06296036_107223 [Pseudobacteriovorax antillogorgiicola]